MMMSLLERLNHAFSGGIMFVQPTAETYKVVISHNNNLMSQQYLIYYWYLT